ncbi:MAG: hypothetical protein EXQ55_08845 [Acidobacteria bacterium]|nr:hypothetical protein [Acidobacteriota bacterium]
MTTRKPVETEISDLRKRLRATIDRTRRDATTRRTRLDEAAAAYTVFLQDMAGPLVRMLANALRAEGYDFTVFAPANGLRLASARTAEDFIEFALDTSQANPSVILRVNRARGRRVVQHERPIGGGAAVERVIEEDVVQALLEEISPFVER